MNYGCKQAKAREPEVVLFLLIPAALHRGLLKRSINYYQVINSGWLVNDTKLTSVAGVFHILLSSAILQINRNKKIVTPLSLFPGNRTEPAMWVSPAGPMLSSQPQDSGMFFLIVVKHTFANDTILTILRMQCSRSKGILIVFRPSPPFICRTFLIFPN